MIDALINGKLAKDTELKTSANNNQYCNFLLSVNVGEPQNIFVSGMAFNEAAVKIARLKKGDSVTITGSLKPNQWQDKTTGETKHGLNITVSECLSVYDVKKRRGNTNN